MRIVSTSIYQPHSDTAIHYVLVEHVQSKRELDKMLNDIVDGKDELDGLPIAGRCNHEHDCCGCWFTSALTVIWFDKIYNTAMVRVDNHRNV